MVNHAIRYVMSVLPLLALCEPAHAATWQICSMELRITAVLNDPYPHLKAKVLRVRPASPTIECPDKDATILFSPETTDYQNILPRRQWPKKGASVHIDYRYLDGLCKGEGHSYECRIKHYPIVSP